jgi:hypothetical protein
MSHISLFTKLLAPAERDAASGRTRSAREFLIKFKQAKSPEVTAIEVKRKKPA